MEPLKTHLLQHIGQLLQRQGRHLLVLITWCDQGERDLLQPLQIHRTLQTHLARLVHQTRIIHHLRAEIIRCMNRLMYGARPIRLLADCCMTLTGCRLRQEVNL